MITNIVCESKSLINKVFIDRVIKLFFFKKLITDPDINSLNNYEISIIIFSMFLTHNVNALNQSIIQF